MPWIPRGLRNGIVTSKYPREPDDFGEGFRGAVDVSAEPEPRDFADLVRACPTGAIDIDHGDVRLNRGACILCGNCVRLAPSRFAFAPTLETSRLRRAALIVPEVEEDSASVDALRESLARRVRSLRRSIHVRHVDAGSDGSDEWEVAALTNPVYDVQRLGIYFTASPRHADVLLVTGVGTLAMAESLQHTLYVMPDPKVVVAAGVEAISGGLVANGYASHGGVDSLIDVDVYVPGSPATPFGLLHGLLMAVNLLPNRSQARGVR